MELYISDHPLDCLTCSANGDCELQDMAGDVGLRKCATAMRARTTSTPSRHSNPYFDFDPPSASSARAACAPATKCRAPSRSPSRAAASTQGFAGRGRVFMDSECVSCGACVQACPTATLQEKSVIELGMPTRSVITTCAYCGVGCSFKAEMHGDELVRMVPYKDGGANEGHSCVKGRFAFGYATHPDRVKKPMIREKITDPWREVEWDEAIGTSRVDARDPAEHGVGAIGGITSSRCTNEEFTSSRRWCAPRSATITSTPARASATRPLATG